MNLLPVGVLATLLASVPAYAATFEFQGSASGENGQVLYNEHHQMAGECTEGRFRPREHQVEYKQPGSDTVFARKQLEFPASPLRPVVMFSQPDFNEKLTIEYPQQDLAAIEWMTPTGGQENFSVTFDQKLVVDSGFDHLVRADWRKLRAGERVEFRFLGPTRGEHFGFVAEPVSDSEINADLIVRLRPTSVFLRMLVDPIVLGYNDQGALTDYRGLTNIRKNADSNHTAHIRYQVSQYPDCPLVP